MATYIVILIAGFLLMWGKTFDSARRKANYSFKTFFDLNAFKFVFGAGAATVSSLSLDYFFGIFQMEGLNYYIAFAVGFSCSALVNEFLKVFRAKTKFD